MKFLLSLAAALLLVSSSNFAVAAPLTLGTLDFNNTTTQPQFYNAFSLGFNGTGAGAKQKLAGTFSYSDFGNTDRATFTANTLTITDVESDFGAYSFLMTFANPDFTGFSLVSDSFGCLPTYSFSGHTFTFNAPATHAQGTYTAVFDYTTNLAAAPEPSGLLLLGTGTLGALGAMRRRIRR